MTGSTRPTGFRPAVPDNLVFDAASAEQSFADAFRAVAAAHGTRVAVADASEPTTYAELDARSDAVASAIVETGSDAPIVVMAGHEAGPIAAMLGIAKAGFVYAVVDGSAPDPYRREVVDRLGARLVVTDRAQLDRVHRLDRSLTRIVLDELPDREFARREIAPDAAMSISFTSGSSGTPKAVVHSHRNVVHNALRIGAVFGLTPEDRFLAAASLQYTATATVVCSSLLAGAAIWPYNFAARGTASFEDDARAVGLSVAQLTPALTAGMAKHAGPEGVPTVRVVSVGGDRLDLRQVHELHTAFPNATIVYRYNTSETNWVAGAVIDPELCDARGRAPVGWPVPWVDVSVRDEHGEPVPAGEVGEVRVGSDFLALGYWGGDDRAETVFSSTATGRVYSTRDRAWQHDDGLLELVGRDDNTVKIRGVLVDPAFVEREIERLAEVRAAAVVAVTDDGPTRLAAFVVVERETPATTIRRALVAALPRAMVPATVTTLDALPVTERGKVHTAALQALAHAQAPPPPSAPRDQLEQRITRRFAEVLGIDDIGRDDDFFALGGDSLDTIELAAALLLDHGATLELSTLVEHPTPAGLARWVRDDAPLRRDLVPLTKGSANRLPIVFFPGSGGTGLHIVQPVASALHDRTSYAVVPHAFEHRGVPDQSIAKKAARAVTDMLALDPAARFVVVGRSSGGITASEAARQLADCGVTPPLLVLLDTAGPVSRRSIRFRDIEQRARFPSESPLRRALHRVRLVTVTWAHEMFFRWTAGVIRRTGPDQVRAFRALMLSALARHRQRSYAGRTVLLRADDRSEDLVEVTTRDLGWAPYLTGSFTIVDVPGSHMGMARGSELAASVAALESVLAEADAVAVAARA